MDTIQKQSHLEKFHLGWKRAFILAMPSNVTKGDGFLGTQCFDNMDLWEAENQFFFLDAMRDALKLQCVKLVVGQDPSRGMMSNYLPGYWNWTL